MKNLYLFLPFTIGIALTLQAAINGQLRAAINSSLMATLISFLVGTLFLVVIILILKENIPALSQFSTIRWYTYTGGILGAFIVMAVILSIKNINPSTLFALIVAGQLLTAIVFEQFGWLGIKQTDISWSKVSGIVLMIASVYLINKKS